MVALLACAAVPAHLQVSHRSPHLLPIGSWAAACPPTRTRRLAGALAKRGYPEGCVAHSSVPCQRNTRGAGRAQASSPNKNHVTSKSPVGDISVVTLIRTDTTLDHSQKAEKVWSGKACVRGAVATLLVAEAVPSIQQPVGGVERRAVRGEGDVVAHAPDDAQRAHKRAMLAAARKQAAS